MISFKRLYDDCLIFLLQQSRMEERLDDAIHVLRHHAEAPLLPGPMGQHGMGPAMMPPPPSHSNGLMGPASMAPGHMAPSPYHMPMPPSHIDSSHMVSAIHFSFIFSLVKEAGSQDTKGISLRL